MSITQALRVLYDGWPLVYEPSSPSALHLMAVLTALPGGVEAVVAMPGPSPHRLPVRVDIQRLPAADTPLSRLIWEQHTLAVAGERAAARLLHMTVPYPPLVTTIPVVLSPADAPAGKPRLLEFSERLRQALAVGATSGVRALLWPQDQSLPLATMPCYSLPPVVHPAFSRPAPALLEMPDGFVLYHGAVDEVSLLQLMEAWVWASAGIGAQTPLVLAGISHSTQMLLDTLIQQAGLGDTVRSLPAVTVEDWARLYQNARVIVHLGPPLPWGSPVLHALAAGKPLVAIEEAQTGERVGPAAYLVPPGDSRAIGAAITTLVVETEMAAALGQAALRRASRWGSARFGDELLKIYQQVER